MINKNVCPNCGQLYDTDLSKCPLCGAAKQVVTPEAPVQRKRITDNERKQRRSDRREAEQEARRRKKEEQLLLDAEEERQIEAEEALRKEEKRRRKEEKKAARKGLPVPAARRAGAKPAGAPRPDRSGRPPEADYELSEREKGRVPRGYLIASCILLLATLVIGSSYLLWKFDKVKIPFYDELAARSREQETQAPKPGEAADRTEPSEQEDSGETELTRPTKGDEILCRSLQLDREEITFDAEGDQTQIIVTLLPEETTEDTIFTTSDESVVKVSPVGILTAVGPGEAVITVVCGEAKGVCRVLCTFADSGGSHGAQVNVDHLELIKTDMTFFHPSENYVLTVTNVPAGTPVHWSSLDETVATVSEGGHVVAVGPGTTNIVATVGDLSAKCIVRCNFKEE